MDDKIIQFPYEGTQWRAVLEDNIPQQHPGRGRLIAEAVSFFTEFEDIFNRTPLNFNVSLPGTEQDGEMVRKTILDAVQKYRDQLKKDLALQLISHFLRQ